MTWKPMSEHTFPWEPDRLTIAVYSKEDPTEKAVFVCECSGGEYYPEPGWMALDEIGWIPYAWTDAPPDRPKET